jgi:hypothetical protein
MKKKCFVDIFWFKCVACNRTNHQKAYYRLFEAAQVPEARRTGLLRYTCHHCKRAFSSQQVDVLGLPPFGCSNTAVRLQSARAILQ